MPSPRKGCVTPVRRGRKPSMKTVMFVPGSVSHAAWRQPMITSPSTGSDCEWTDTSDTSIVSSSSSGPMIQSDTQSSPSGTSSSGSSTETQATSSSCTSETSSTHTSDSEDEYRGTNMLHRRRCRKRVGARNRNGSVICKACGAKKNGALEACLECSGGSVGNGSEESAAVAAAVARRSVVRFNIPSMDLDEVCGAVADVVLDSDLETMPGTPAVLDDEEFEDGPLSNVSRDADRSCSCSSEDELSMSPGGACPAPPPQRISS